MRNLMITVALMAATASPAAAQDDGGVQEGFNLLEKGVELMLRGLVDEVQPMMEDFATELEPQLRALALELGPVLRDLAELMGDLDEYNPPERLPNGDIILRRKVPERDGLPIGPGPEIDL